MLITKSQIQVSSSGTESRCECGQLIAKIRSRGLELKCKRCKRIVLIPFTTIEGWTTLTT
ncbi:MAG: hypothetical protein ACREIS_03370 [Nitrospiraceae bacterium]